MPLLALLHGSHAHRFCAAHGTFEEAAPAAGDERELSVGDTAGPRVLNAASEDFAEGHEECPLLGAWARQGLPGPGPACVDGGASVAVSRDMGLSWVPPQVTMLAVAPKGSPPRA
ncbi:hypothetical protein [Corallococcus sp. RDP092CA]|uniref:hypothetical protein n=1 Tax=Corallococcus sp. RDP092CA TaxID=3109369 RepID=UPI0035AE95E9